ncbi:MAG: aspartate carbamoyltransferase regulatory subunit, partial [Anaerorhabdus sp.]
VLGYIDPNISVCIIKDGKVSEKQKLTLPKQIKNVHKCKNPRCITSIEQELDHIFYLADEETQTYRCIYCETKKG